MSGPNRIRCLALAIVVATSAHAWPSGGSIRAADSWESVSTAAAALAPATSFLVGEVADGECQPITSVDPDRRVAIASTFKLYVLGELGRQVALGQASWDEPLTVSSRWKSKPSGSMRDEPPGTRHPLRYFAEQMIAESDNTATDHLIARLGRENVEAVLSLLGHGDPELDTPLLMTRELFAFKIAGDERLVDAYLAAPDDEQRRILQTAVDPVPLDGDGWGTWNGPRWIDSVEWFASASDLCRALARLQVMAEQPGLGPIAEIMTANRGGTVFDRRTWPEVAFKEGYEAGVYSQAWLLRRADGRRFVVVAGYNDPTRFIDQTAAWNLTKRAAALLTQLD